MSEVVMLRGAEPRKVLLAAVEKKELATMSCLMGGKWHTLKVSLASLQADRLGIKVSPGEGPCPADIRIEQPVGLSFNHQGGKFIVETKVAALAPSAEPQGAADISLVVPDRIEVVQRRSYIRISVPKNLKVNVTLWHRFSATEENLSQDEVYYKGRLVDISAGGTRVSVDASQRPCFEEGQVIGLRFTPMPYEMPLMFNAQIKNIVPATDGSGIYIGLQIIGLESGSEGRQALSRLVGVVDRYKQINQTTASPGEQTTQAD